MTELSGSEKFWYYLGCICSFGGLYFIKLAAKKALAEENTETALRQHR